MKKFYIFYILILLSQVSVFSQNDEDTLKYYNKVSADEFNYDLFNKLLFNEINKYRVKNELDSILLDDILINAAEDNAKYMAFHEEETTIQAGKRKTTGRRIKYYGGSEYGYELVKKISIKKGQDYLTYKQLADEILYKWTGNKKNSQIFYDKQAIFVGISSALDEKGRKLYVSAVFGNYKSFNDGAEKRNDLDVKYTKRKYGLKHFDFKACKKCNVYKGISDLQKGLFVRDGKIWFKTDNLKKFSKLIKGGRDGIAVDIVQKVQYSCEDDNIIDNNLVNKGILKKRVWANKLYKKNVYKNDKKLRKKKLEAPIAKWPKKLTGDLEEYELNLLIIKDKHVCYNLPPTYLEEASIEYNGGVDFLPDTIITDGDNTEYMPKPETTVLNFRIPFEKNKYVYNKQDIQGFLDKLNEPDFIVDEITIKAYSSIEGNVQANKKLQQKRAQSIVDALKERQNGKEINTKIFTADNWDDFKNDVAGTEYSNLANMSLAEAQKYIKEHKLAEKLEPILKNHRYAEITMTITYDIKGKKEQNYVVSRFNKAAASCNKELALKIQKYIIKKVINDEYTSQAVYDMKIDSTKADCAGLLMNKLWLQKYVSDDEINDDYCKKIDYIYNLDAANEYMIYNKYLCMVENDAIKSGDYIRFQRKINKLYESNLQKEIIDNLNLEFQFMVIDHLDTLAKPSPMVQESLNNIKQIVKIDGAGWRDALKLAYLFMEHHDYDFAAKLLEPYIYQKNVFDELVFTYISLCTHSNYRMMSNRFYTAMKRANKLDHERFCELFKSGKLTVQSLENTLVKHLYCKSCSKQ